MKTQTKKPVDKNQMRVAIAKDVISRINKKLFVPEKQLFVSFEKEHEIFSAAEDLDVKGKDFRKVLNKERCDVCAVGGLFVSCFIKNNSMKLDSFFEAICNDADAILNYLKKYFSFKQLQMIEAAFELEGNGWFDSADRNYNYNHNYLISDEVKIQCHNFGIEYEVPTDRMIAIMRNIIKNKGLFKPSK